MTDIKVMSAGACEGPVHELAPEFTAATGHPVGLNFSTVGALRDRFKGGEQTDVIILSVPAIEALEREGRLLAGSRLVLGHAACGVAVRDGMLMPDISTVEAFKRALLHTQTVGATDPAHGGSSGIYLADLLKRLGIHDAVQPKMVLGRNGREVGLSVARGEAELGITFTSEFVPLEGVRVVGPLPKEIAYVNGYAAALPAGSPSEAARAFMTFLASPSAKARFRAFGLE